MFKAVIFDMDGVLIDSVHIAREVRKKLLATYGVNLDEVPDPQGEDHRAASVKTLLASVKNHSGIHIDHDEFAGMSREYGNKEMQERGVSADPNLIAFLEDLKQHNTVCAIASSGLRNGVTAKLNILKIAQYFSVIVTGSEVQEHKPSPESYLYTMQKLGLSPDDCVIFEDSLTGIQAGRAAGCRVVGFTQYNPPKEPVDDVIATVGSWSDISYGKLKQLVSH